MLMFPEVKLLSMAVSIVTYSSCTQSVVRFVESFITNLQGPAKGCSLGPISWATQAQPQALDPFCGVGLTFINIEVKWPNE